MKNDWVEIYTTQDSIEAEITKQKLERESIEVSLLNKQDSSYLNFGSVHLYVAPEDAVRAKRVLDKTSPDDV